MTIPTNQQAYSSSVGTATIRAPVFSQVDPSASDSNYVLYQSWINLQTKAIWYFEGTVSSNGQNTAQWRSVGPVVLSLRDPTSADYLYPIGQFWVNTASSTYWGLVNVVADVATWENLSSGVSSGILTLTGNSGGAVGPDGSRNVNIVGASGQIAVTGDPGDNTLTISFQGGLNPVTQIEVDASTSPGTDPVLASSSGEITIAGAQVAAGTTVNVLRTNSLSPNSLRIEVQRSQAVAASTIADNGVSHFNDLDFTVDNNGFVSLLSSGLSRLVQVDTFESPGTNPVTPAPGGLITVTGGQVAAGSTSNVIRTDSLAANTYTIQVQRSEAVATSNAADNGVCHFNSANFNVDSNGFVTIIGGGGGSVIIVGDSGSMTGSTLTISGGSTGITTTASGVTMDLTGTLNVAHGGTGDATFTVYSPIVGGTTTTGALQSAGTGQSNVGYVLTSTGASSVPTWQAGGGGGGSVTIDGDSGSMTGSTLTISGGSTGLTTTASGVTMDLTGTLDVGYGGTGDSTFTAYSPVVGGTTTTGALQSASSGQSNAGYVLTSTGSSSLPTWQPGGGGGSGFSAIHVQVLTTSGTYTPTSGMLYAWVQMVGAGGGGGGSSIDGGDQSPSGSGGGGGMYASKVYSAGTIGSSQSVTIGTGGTGGVAQADGTSGGSTVFGSLITVAGGVNGSYMRTNGPIQEGGDGGQALSGTPDYVTYGGGGGYAFNAGGAVVSGAGGSSLLSPGGKARGIPADGVPGGGYGGGGSGGVAQTGTPGNGGNGDNGVIIITEYI